MSSDSTPDDGAYSRSIPPSAAPALVEVINGGEDAPAFARRVVGSILRGDAQTGSSAWTSDHALSQLRDGDLASLLAQAAFAGSVARHNRQWPHCPLHAAPRELLLLRRRRRRLLLLPHAAHAGLVEPDRKGVKQRMECPCAAAEFTTAASPRRWRHSQSVRTSSPEACANAASLHDATGVSRYRSEARGNASSKRVVVSIAIRAEDRAALHPRLRERAADRRGDSVVGRPRRALREQLRYQPAPRRSAERCSATLAALCCRRARFGGGCSLAALSDRRRPRRRGKGARLGELGSRVRALRP